MSTNESQYYLNTVSDALRVVLLSRFGGAYLDSDIISRKGIPIGRDSYGLVVAEENDRINNAVLIFHKDNKFLPLLLQEQVVQHLCTLFYNFYCHFFLFV